MSNASDNENNDNSVESAIAADASWVSLLSWADNM
jgi:hypothetical protein